MKQQFTNLFVFLFVGLALFGTLKVVESQATYHWNNVCSSNCLLDTASYWLAGGPIPSPADASSGAILKINNPMSGYTGHQYIITTLHAPQYCSTGASSGINGLIDLKFANATVLLFTTCLGDDQLQTKLSFSKSTLISQASGGPYEVRLYPQSLLSFTNSDVNWRRSDVKSFSGGVTVEFVSSNFTKITKTDNRLNFYGSGFDLKTDDVLKLDHANINTPCAINVPSNTFLKLYGKTKIDSQSLCAPSYTDHYIMGNLDVYSGANVEFTKTLHAQGFDVPFPASTHTIASNGVLNLPNYHSGPDGNYNFDIHGTLNTGNFIFENPTTGFTRTVTFHPGSNLNINGAFDLQRGKLYFRPLAPDSTFYRQTVSLKTHVHEPINFNLHFNELTDATGRVDLLCKLVNYASTSNLQIVWPLNPANLPNTIEIGTTIIDNPFNQATSTDAIRAPPDLKAALSPANKFSFSAPINQMNSFLPSLSFYSNTTSGASLHSVNCLIEDNAATGVVGNKKCEFNITIEVLPTGTVITPLSTGDVKNNGGLLKVTGLTTISGGNSFTAKAGASNFASNVVVSANSQFKFQGGNVTFEKNFTNANAAMVTLGGVVTIKGHVTAGTGDHSTSGNGGIELENGNINGKVTINAITYIHGYGKVTGDLTIKPNALFRLSNFAQDFVVTNTLDLQGDAALVVSATESSICHATVGNLVVHPAIYFQLDWLPTTNTPTNNTILTLFKYNTFTGNLPPTYTDGVYNVIVTFVDNFVSKEIEVHLSYPPPPPPPVAPVTPTEPVTPTTPIEPVTPTPTPQEPVAVPDSTPVPVEVPVTPPTTPTPQEPVAEPNSTAPIPTEPTPVPTEPQPVSPTPIAPVAPTPNIDSPNGLQQNADVQTTSIAVGIVIPLIVIAVALAFAVYWFRFRSNRSAHGFKASPNGGDKAVNVDTKEEMNGDNNSSESEEAEEESGEEGNDDEEGSDNEEENNEGNSAQEGNDDKESSENSDGSDEDEGSEEDEAAERGGNDADGS